MGDRLGTCRVVVVLLLLSKWIVVILLDKVLLCCTQECLRPYHVETTSSRLITEVKQRRAASVLGWVTAWEYAVL